MVKEKVGEALLGTSGGSFSYNGVSLHDGKSKLPCSMCCRGQHPTRVAQVHQPKGVSYSNTNQKAENSKSNYEYTSCFLIVSVLTDLLYWGLHCGKDFSHSRLKWVLRSCKPRLLKPSLYNECLGYENSCLSLHSRCRPLPTMKFKEPAPFLCCPSILIFEYGLKQLDQQILEILLYGNVHHGDTACLGLFTTSDFFGWICWNVQLKQTVYIYIYIGRLYIYIFFF